MIWLASGSPRRRQLLTWAGHEVEVHPADIDESPREAEAAVVYARRLAVEKAAGAPEEALVVAADTVVHRGEVLFGKPMDRGDAERMLTSLSGGWHAVTTGWSVRRGGTQQVGHTTTEVRFRELRPSEIRAYVETGEADDKAGAYGIQGRAGVFVAEVRGCWTNVMGLPMEDVLRAIASIDEGGAA